MASFDSGYPCLTRWIRAGGALTLGGDEPSFVVLSDGLRHVWADWGSFASLAEALAAAEAFARDPDLHPGRPLRPREVSLRAWLSTGTLGPLVLGARAEEVEAWLGPPEEIWMWTKDQAVDSALACEGWAHGELELHFEGGVLVGMALPWGDWSDEARGLRWLEDVEGLADLEELEEIERWLEQFHSRARAEGSVDVPRASMHPIAILDDREQVFVTVGVGARRAGHERYEPRAIRRIDSTASEAACLPSAFDRLFEHGARLAFDHDGGNIQADVFDRNGWLGSSRLRPGRLDEILAEAAEAATQALARVRTPIAVSFSQFVATGRLGPISLGMSPRQIEELLGPPENMLFAGGGWGDPYLADIWKFHELELYFEGDEASGRRLFQISRSALSYHVEPVPSRAFVIDFDILIDGTLPNYEQVEALADRLGLEWEYLFAYDQAHIVLSSGVFFIFESQYRADGWTELTWTASNRDQWSRDCVVAYVGTNPEHVERIRRAARGR